MGQPALFSGLAIAKLWLPSRERKFRLPATLNSGQLLIPGNTAGAPTGEPWATFGYGLPSRIVYRRGANLNPEAH
jgi:hypothetical protein